MSKQELQYLYGVNRNYKSKIPNSNIYRPKASNNWNLEFFIFFGI